MTTISSVEKDAGGEVLQVPPPSSMEAKTGVAIRQGGVRVKECGTAHPSNWFFTMKWLVLYEKLLALHPSQVRLSLFRFTIFSLVNFLVFAVDFESPHVLHLACQYRQA